MAQIGGVSLTWDENSPSNEETAGLGDDRIRSLISTIRTGLDAEHVWNSAGGTGMGAHVLGSARVFVGTQSQVSSVGTDGRLMWASDSSRLFHVGSGGTALLGGPTMLSVGSLPGSQRYMWQMEMGTGITNSSGSTIVTIHNSGFSGIPFTTVTVTQASVVGQNVHAQIVNFNPSTFIVSTIGGASSAFIGDVPFCWMSVGTRTL
jgi:hypothetical protein